MKKATQIIFFLLLSMSLVFPAKTVFSQEDDNVFLSYTPLAFRAMVNDTLEGKNGIEALRGVRDSYSQGLDDLATGFINNRNQGALEAYEEYRSVTLKYLDARLKQAEERARQAENDHFRNVIFVIHAVLMDGADSVNENAPTNPNPVVDKILPVLQDQTKKNTTDLLYGHIASQIPDSGAVVIFNISSQMYNVDAGIPFSSASSVTSQGDAENNGNGGGGTITIQKPLQFANGGLYDATVRVASYTPADGVRAGMSGASTVVFRGSNPSANLSLPIGTYVFCYDWDLGTDADKDGYVDYGHKNTGSVTLTVQSTDNAGAAQVVTLDPGNNQNGKCGETAPPASGSAGGLTPQELANQGTHTYRIDCPTEEILNSEAWVTSNNFVAGGANIKDENGSWFYNKINVNTYFYDYSEIDIPITYTFTFTNEGFTLLLVGDGKSSTCTGTRR